ncbi:hypothetical protein FRB94_008091 [Tulasnella sp. JGI-2019a]|nr:hypothetical protein FRB94_008091 [Tulasnella sp. JGI-2019a]
MQSERSGKPKLGNSQASKKQRRHCRVSGSGSSQVHAPRGRSRSNSKPIASSPPDDIRRLQGYSRASRPTRLSTVFEHAASRWLSNHPHRIGSDEVVVVTDATKLNIGGSSAPWWSWLINSRSAITNDGTSNPELHHTHTPTTDPSHPSRTHSPEVAGQPSANSDSVIHDLVAAINCQGGEGGGPRADVATQPCTTTNADVTINANMNVDEVHTRPGGSQDSHSDETSGSCNASTSSLASMEPVSGLSRTTLTTTPGHSSVDVCAYRLGSSPLAQQGYTATDDEDAGEDVMAEVVQLNRSNSDDKPNNDEDEDESDWEDEDESEQDQNDIGMLRRLIPHASLPNTTSYVSSIKLNTTANTLQPPAPTSFLPTPSPRKPSGPGDAFWGTKHSRWRGDSSLQHEMCFRYWEDSCSNIHAVIIYGHEQEKLWLEMKKAEVEAGIRNIEVEEDSEDSVGWKESIVAAAKTTTKSVGLGIVGAKLKSVGVVSGGVPDGCLCLRVCEGDCGATDEV